MNNSQRIPILKVGRVLIVPIQVDMDDQNGDGAPGTNFGGTGTHARAGRSDRYLVA